MKQKWGKLKYEAKTMYMTIPFNNFCHGTQKPNKYPNVKEEKVDEALQILVNSNKLFF